MEQPLPQTASAPQIRSRITVVCAECKRLKLKCDRRSPCSSCTKRDTVARCIYSPAAAEKVDLHSLNNRLMQVEATLAQLTAGTFQSSYPPAHPQNMASANSLPPPLAPPAANPPPSRNIPFPPHNHQHHHHPAAVTSHVHDAPCPLALSLDELRSAWLDSVDSTRSGRSASGRPLHPVKFELSPADTERQMRLRAKMNAGAFPHSRHSNPQPYLPALNIYYSPSQQSYGPQSHASSIPSVTPAVLDLLPSMPACMRILARAKPVLAQRPVPLPGGWSRFEAKALSILGQRAGGQFVAPLVAPSPSSDAEVEPERPRTANGREKEKKKAEESLPFFAITVAVLAIGAAVSPPEVIGSENINAGYLYALSQQALSVWENAPAKKGERDYVLYLVACLAGIGYLLLATPDSSDNLQERGNSDAYGGKARAIFPLVGKVVNVAREIGLGKEKAAWQEGDNEAKMSSRPEARRAWEDFRRVVWWDVMFYDLFTSDALGHPSLIPPLPYSPKLPEIAGSVYDSSAKKYVLARCRLIQLAQRVKHRISHPDCCCGYTFDQASALDEEIRKWSRDSISQDDDEKADERRHNWELALVAQVLVLRAHVPFLISAGSAAGAKKQASGVSGPAKVLGKPGLGEKPTIQGSALATATQSCLGAAQAILRLGNKLNNSLYKEPSSPNPIVVPMLMDLYPLEKMVLDAVVITQSSTAVSVVSEAEVRRGMEIMMEREFTLGKERREIWESMKQRVHLPSRLQIPQGSQPMKRKHDQLSPVVGSANDVTQKKQDGVPSKHAKTSAGPLPVLGVRFRQGRMGPTGPIHPVDSVYEREAARNYALSTPQPEGTPTQMNTPHSIPPQQLPRSMGPYDTSPPDFAPDQPTMQSQSQHPPVEHSMTGHRNSFDQAQSKQMYTFEDASMPASAYTEYAHNGASTHGSSSSSSPYQAATPYNPPQFGSPDNSATRTPSSQVTSDSPNLGYGAVDGQGPSGGPPKFGSDPRPPFENPRPAFMTENPQPQVFEKMLPPNSFPHSGDQSPPVSGTPSVEHPSHDPGAPQFSVAQHNGNPAQGYFHPGTGIGSYDAAGGMLPLGMRMEDSVPNTPMYEKPHMVYDNKAPQHQMIQHGQHHIPLNGQPQHSVVGGGFVGDQPQALAMSGAPQPPHQTWPSNQAPQPLVAVPAGQGYW